jgi:hypothetical protein
MVSSSLSIASCDSFHARRNSAWLYVSQYTLYTHRTVDRSKIDSTESIRTAVTNRPWGGRSRKGRRGIREKGENGTYLCPVIKVICRTVWPFSKRLESCMLGMYGAVSAPYAHGNIRHLGSPMTDKTDRQRYSLLSLSTQYILTIHRPIYSLMCWG